MAIYNEILVGRFARSFQKLFGMKGGAAVRQLAGELAPSHVVFSGRENRYLEGWQSFAARQFQGAVAAQDTVVRIQNPAGSNIVGVIEGISMWVSAADQLFLEFSATAQANLSAINTPAAFDTRQQPSGTGQNGAALQVSSANNIGAAGFVTFGDVVVNAQFTQEMVNYDAQEIVMMPGTAIQVRDANLNTGLHVTWRWRERFLEESERT
jgi:hypothetical protein